MANQLNKNTNRTDRVDAKKNEQYSEMQASSQFDKNTREPSQSSAGTIRDADTAKAADRNAATGAPGQGKALYGKSDPSAGQGGMAGEGGLTSNARSGGMAGEGQSSNERSQTTGERGETEALQNHGDAKTSVRVDNVNSPRKSNSDY